MRDNLGNILDRGECISEEMMLNYLNGKLTPTEQHRVEKHLLGCEICGDAFDGLSMDSSANHSAALDDLDKKIDARIKQGSGRVIKMNVFYRIAAILVVLALFGGGFYYLLSIKKSEKIFTENFGPYHDSTRTNVPIAVVPPAFKEGAQVMENEMGPSSKQAEQNISKKENANALSGESSNKREVSVSKPESGDLSAQSTTAATGSVYKIEKKATSGKVAEEKDVRSIAADEETFDKKQLSDVTKSDVAVEKNMQPAMPKEIQSAKNSSRIRDAYADQAPAAPESPTNDSVSGGTAVLIDNGIKQYDAKNYAVAVTAFQQVLNNEPANTEALFYNGVSNLSLNNDADAINLLESVVKNSPNKFSDAAKWYLSLAYIKKNKTSKAKKILKELSVGNSEYKPNAEKALNELR